MRKSKIKEQLSGRHKMAIGVVFQFLKIVGDIETRNRIGVPQTRSARKITSQNRIGDCI